MTVLDVIKLPVSSNNAIQREYIFETIHLKERQNQRERKVKLSRGYVRCKKSVWMSHTNNLTFLPRLHRLDFTVIYNP